MSYPPQGGYPPPGGYGGGYGAPAAAPANNMTMAVISLVVGVLCGGCLGAIPGIVAVVNANKVGGLAASGNYGGAQEAAGKAKTWAIIAFVVSAIVFVAGVILQLAVIGSDSSTNY